VLTFVILFYIFNFMPVFNVHYDSIFLPATKWCSLNYLYCYNDFSEGTFPDLLNSSLFALFIFPILLPGFFTFLIYKIRK